LSQGNFKNIDVTIDSVIEFLNKHKDKLGELTFPKEGNGISFKKGDTEIGTFLPIKDGF
jgi:hypothetical protein